MLFKEFFKIIKYFGQGRKLKLIGFLVLSVIAACLEFIGVGFVYPFVLMVINPDIITNTSYFQVFETFVGSTNHYYLTFILGLITLVMFVSKNILMIICLYFQTKFTYNWKSDVCTSIVKFFLFSPYQNSIKTTFAEKMHLLSTLTTTSFDVYLLRCLILISNSIIVAVMMMFILVKVPIAAIVSGLFILLTFIIQNKFFKRRINYYGKKLARATKEYNKVLIETIKNIKFLKILCVENQFLTNYQKKQSSFKMFSFYNNFYSSISSYIVELLVIITLFVLVLLILVQNLSEPSLFVAEFGFTLASIFRITPSLNKIQLSINQINISKPMARQLTRMYEEYKFDKINMIDLDEQKISFEKRIELKNISSEYRKSEPVLKGLSIEINKGEFIGIVGLSGAGKSTLVDTIMGLLPITEGEMFVDDYKITQQNSHAFRKLIGYVPQNIDLFENSVRNNIAWGVKPVDIDNSRIEQVLKDVQMYDFVMQLPNGIDTILSAGKSGLSQGQMQRILIARALYRNPEIIILDEATSALDLEVEDKITQMLTKLKKNKTIIAIAHRLSTLKNCDKLIYMKDGRVVDMGTFKELAKRYKDFENLIKLSKL